MTFEPEDDALLPELLPFIVQSDPFFEHALGTSSGSLSPRTRWSQLKDFAFPLPPKDEQRRIAEMLHSVDATTEAFSDAMSRCDKLRRVLLFQLMSGHKSSGSKVSSKLGPIPKSWDVVSIGEAGSVQLGRQRAPKYQTGSFTKPYLRVANVFDGYLDLSDVLEMDFDEKDFATYSLNPGDILLNEGQSRELVGRCAMYQGEIQDCCFQNTLVRFRAGERLIEEFAFFYFQYLFYKGVFASIARQTTSIAHLGADRFSKLPMAIPPMDEQQQIVRILKSTQESKAEITSHLEGLFVLKKSLTDEILRSKT